MQHAEDLRLALERVESQGQGIQRARHHADELLEHQTLVAWLSPTDFPAQYSDLMSHRQEGTGQWFLEASEYLQWLNEPKSVLFCPGIPGAGKTMIAAIAIENLLEGNPGNSEAIAYVFCSYKARWEQNTSRILASILKQLVQNPAAGTLLDFTKKMYEKHKFRGTRPLTDEILEALQLTIATLGTVYIVIDGLDEWSTETRLPVLSKLKVLQTGADIRLMITSRAKPEIVDSFKEAITLEIHAHDKDVERFVAGQMFRLPECIQSSDALQELVSDKIVNSASGMCVLRSSNHCLGMLTFS